MTAPNPTGENDNNRDKITIDELAREYLSQKDNDDTERVWLMISLRPRTLLLMIVLSSGAGGAVTTILNHF